MKKKILFLTSANLATNPRLVKEIDSLSSTYSVEVILFKFLHWSNDRDENMRKERNHIKFSLYDISKRNILAWALYGIIEKFCRTIYPVFKASLFVTAGALSRKSLKLVFSTKKNEAYDLIIAHNLPALYPAYFLSKKWRIPFGFDIEDFDPGMKYPDAGKNYKKICTQLYVKLFPKAAYLSSASPLIGNYALQLCGGHDNHVTLINSFPEKEFIEPSININTKSLKFVWYSLTISFERGLEEFFVAAKMMNCEIEVTLIGNMHHEFEEKIIKPVCENCPNIKVNIIAPLSQAELHKELKNHHIGLALEKPNKELNREICLTNKIISYAQAGLYILATNTLAQKEFLESKGIGLLCEMEKLLEALKDVIQKQDEIISGSFHRFEKNRILSWEKQIPLLNQKINAVLKS